ncbi:DEAD/DEAH box helicase [Rubrivivax gelatinosus]|uniref:Superfamily II DNA/RNA helicase n=1 Tax=Rubrivivax gelatinosus TaxID=28068 RepID=A0A4R2M758_RUBGE|nr:DEAD/DEAH box helicase [Rubrivivax gelatinosus]MBK1686938.1 RNA helicase [Rubrivivax gelatinosus]TCP02120.1 superfamily II DNA/RNA helicase [Rubrivivax gelatinosus]
MSFDTLGLPEALARAVADAGYTTPTEVQSRAIPPALAGADLMVSSSTGSGKTASFVLPALTRILAARGDATRREKGVVSGPRILVLAPTRELAMQVAKATNDYGRHVQGLRVATIVGGVPYGAQLKALRGPLDVLIATPGRLMDHMASGRAVLANVEMLVLDEADRMLDMGFIDDIHHIASATPAARQTVMYSATFAGHVGRLAEELLRQPQRIEIASHTDVHADIEQRLHWADNFAHKNALLDHILTERSVEQAVVFTSTQRDADWLADRLAEMGHHVASLHGGHPQGRRSRVLQGLRSRDLKILVATDVAARGIDVPTISHVINFGLPMKAEDYVHRIGRTGRAGRSGLAVTLAERGDAGMIHRIQRFTTQRIPSATIEGLEPKMPEPMREARPPRAGFGGRPQGGKPFHGGGKPFGGKSFAGKSFGGGAPARERDGERSFGPRAHHDEGFAAARAPRGPFDAPARSFGDRAERGAAPGKPFGHGAGKPFGKPFAKPEGKFGGKPAGKFGPKPGPRRPREA